jgi:ATP-dependent DNA helicase DinG
VIEVEVHQQLRAFLREHGESAWNHHLTMARLVARALRVGRSALIQAGAPSGYHGRYRISYLMPLLLWQDAAILVVPESLQQRLLLVEIPRLQRWLSKPKIIRTGDRYPDPQFQGLFITSPEAWLGDRLTGQQTGQYQFPPNIPTLIDGVDDLETWTRQQLTHSIHPKDWDELIFAFPDQAERIRAVQAQLTHSIFQHPTNPYDCYLIDRLEQDLLLDLHQNLQLSALPVLDQRNGSTSLNPLPQDWQAFIAGMQKDTSLLWTEVSRRQGQCSLHCAPVDVASYLNPIWAQQPVVLIGGALDLESEAPIYRQNLGLEDVTCLKFCPDRHQEIIHLYLPEGIPLPNTEQFQPALLRELRSLLSTTYTVTQGLTVILVGDTPLKAQVGSNLAAEFGSRVQVEKTCLDDRGILVTGWEFWRQHQAVIPAPQLLVIATLPLPSLENPLVAGRVAHYKRSHQDWFRLYLLPEAIRELQRAIAPVRESQGIVALLDNRVIHRSYGQQILAALSPLAKLNYIDESLFLPLEHLH